MISYHVETLVITTVVRYFYKKEFNLSRHLCPTYMICGIHLPPTHFKLPAGRLNFLVLCNYHERYENVSTTLVSVKKKKEAITSDTLILPLR